VLRVKLELGVRSGGGKCPVFMHGRSSVGVLTSFTDSCDGVEEARCLWGTGQ